MSIFSTLRKVGQPGPTWRPSCVAGGGSSNDDMDPGDNAEPGEGGA